MKNNFQLMDQQFEKARSLYLDNRFEAAEIECLQIRQQHPLAANNLNLLGLINFNLNNLEKSISFLESAVSIEQSNLDYLICLGDVLHAVDRKTESEKCYLKAQSIDSENPEIKHKLFQIQDLPLENMAIISCHGWSGSNWMATALNLHEKIICTHSARNLISDGVTQDLKATVLERARARNNRSNNSISSIFNGIKSNGSADIYACVHTLRARDLIRYLKNTPANLSITVANLIRNPISVVSSGVGQLSELVEFDVFTLNEVTTTAKHYADAYYKICELYNIDPCGLEYLCSFDACSHLRYLHEDIATANTMNNIHMERLVADSDYFSECFNFISNGEIADAQYLKKVYQLGRINRHKKKKKSLSAKEEWLSWPDWKKEMFRFFLNQTDVFAFYSKQGYELGYL